MIIMVVFFRLPLSSLVRIPSVLPQLFNTAQFLLLLPNFLVFTKFFLSLQLIVFFLLFFSLSMLHGWVHAVAVVMSAEGEYICIFYNWSAFLLGDFLVERLTVLLDRVFCVFVNRDFNHSFVLDLFFWAMEVFKIRVPERLLDRDAVFGVEDKHLANQVQGLLIHLRKKWRKRALFYKSNLINALVSHHWLHRLDLIPIWLT